MIFSNGLMCTTGRRILKVANTCQGPRKKRFGPSLRAGGKPRQLPRKYLCGGMHESIFFTSQFPCFETPVDPLVKTGQTRPHGSKKDPGFTLWGYPWGHPGSFLEPFVNFWPKSAPCSMKNLGELAFEIPPRRALRELGQRSGICVDVPPSHRLVLGKSTRPREKVT